MTDNLKEQQYELSKFELDEICHIIAKGVRILKKIPALQRRRKIQ